MKQYSLHLHLSSIPSVFKRNKHALILLRNAQGKYVLGLKNHYPEGIARMIGGGLEPYEDPQLGASRELNEETGLSVTPEELIPLATINADITGPDEQKWHFLTFVYLYDLGDQALIPNDDLDGMVELTEAAFGELIERFKHLPTQMHPEMKFRWSDYGLLYGQIHQIVLDEARQHP